MGIRHQIRFKDAGEDSIAVKAYKQACAEKPEIGELRPRMSTRRRRHIFFENSGICHYCAHAIDPKRERFEIIHIDAWAISRNDSNANTRPAHLKCHQRATAEEDLPLIAHIKRVEAFDRGFTGTTSPMPAGRNSPFKKKIGGRIERR